MAKLTLSEEDCPNDVIKPMHAHKRAYFEVILKGGYTEYENRRNQQHRSLSVAFQPIVDSHFTHIHTEGLHCLKIEMSSGWLDRIVEELNHPSAHGLDAATNFAHGTLPWLGVRLYNEWQKMDVVSPLTIEGLVLEMIAEAIRSKASLPERTPPRWLKEAKDLLHAEFTQPLTLEGIAQTVNIHPVFLARVFRQQFGCTVGDYVRRLRIEYACKELATADVSLSDVALAAGFSDQSHFSKVFKRHVGLSPGTFRNHCLASPCIAKTHPENIRS